MNIIIQKTICVIAAIHITCFIAGCGEQGRTGKELIPASDLGTTIGSLVEVSWPESIRLEGCGLVGGLKGTGSAECPPQIRAYLARRIPIQLPAHKINIEKFISSSRS